MRRGGVLDLAGMLQGCFWEENNSLGDYFWGGACRGVRIMRRNRIVERLDLVQV